jgi:hypothetical protein
MRPVSDRSSVNDWPVSATSMREKPSASAKSCNKLRTLWAAVRVSGLSSRLGLPVSDDTLLRRIKQLGEVAFADEAIRALGVDDWAVAFRKGPCGHHSPGQGISRRNHRSVWLLPGRYEKAQDIPDV